MHGVMVWAQANAPRAMVVWDYRLASKMALGFAYFGDF